MITTPAKKQNIRSSFSVFLLVGHFSERRWVTSEKRRSDLVQTTRGWHFSISFFRDGTEGNRDLGIGSAPGRDRFEQRPTKETLQPARDSDASGKSTDCGAQAFLKFSRLLPSPLLKLRKAQRGIRFCILLIYRGPKELVVLFEALHVTRRLQDPLEQIQKRRCVGSLLTLRGSSSGPCHSERSEAELRAHFL